MSKRVGKDWAVKLGSDTVVGIGSVSIDGINTEQFDASEFGDEWMQFLYGMKDGGSVTFNGHYDPDDVTGQQALQQANLYNSSLTNLRVYVDNTSYFEPCQTTGYFSPNLTQNAPTELSSVVITALSVNADKSGLGQISFTGKVNGCMVLI